MAQFKTIELGVKGMDCAECSQHVQHAIAALPGVETAQVFLASEKAVVKLDPEQVSLQAIEKAVAGAGYSLAQPEAPIPVGIDFTHRILSLFGIVFGLVLFVVVFGEWLGLFETITDAIPWPVGWAFVLLTGYPIFA